jgi:hypothetical protein
MIFHLQHLGAGVADRSWCSGVTTENMKFHQGVYMPALAAGRFILLGVYIPTWQMLFINDLL